MSGVVVTVEVIVGVVAAVLLGLALVTVLRRRTIGQGHQLILCGLRGTGETHWRYGLLRTGGTALDWFTLFGLSLRPRHTWDRIELDFGIPRELASGTGMDTLVPIGLVVPGVVGDESFELALARAPYTALRSWLEASPPGRHIDIA